MKLATQYRFSWVRQKQQAWHDKWEHYWDSVSDIRVDTGQWNFEVLSDDSLRGKNDTPPGIRLNDRGSHERSIQS